MLPSNIPVDDEMKECLRATASPNPVIRENAQRAFAATLNFPIRQGIFDRDNLGEIYERHELTEGATANYPLDFIKPGEEDLYVAYALPKQGRLPERHVEGDELWVPTFEIGNAIDWDIRYAKEARFDVVSRAIDVYEAGFVRKLNSDGWRTLLTAAADRGLVVTAGGSGCFTGNTLRPTFTDGVFDKELISRMKTCMTRGAGGNGNAGRLTDVYLSVEAMEDVRSWGATQIDDFTRRQVYTSREYGISELYGVLLHQMTEFGEGQEYQLFLANTLGVSQPSNTSEFCVGLDLTTMDSFVMPIREELQTLDDPGLYRQRRMGVFGWMSHGFACLDNRRILLGAY